MSKVVNAIMATKGDQVRLKQTKLFRDVFAIREDIAEAPGGLQIQYRVGVTLGAQCWVGEFEQMKNENAVELAIQRTKRQVIEAIFGEFRTDFRLIERELYDGDIESARIAFHELENKMFNVTLEGN